MLSAIFFGTLTSIVIYIILKVLFEEYNHTNFLLNYVYGVVFLIISVLILIFRAWLSRFLYNIYFWNTLLISTSVITIWIWGYIFIKTKFGDEKQKQQ